MQQVQGQLSGTKEQLHLIQKRLGNSSDAQAQAPFASGSHSNSHAQPAEPNQEYGLDQQYQNAQAYPGDQDADMDLDLEPPGSARGLHRDPSFDPPDMGRPGAGPSIRDEGLGATGSEGQDQGQDDLYSPGLSAQPSGSYMAEPSLHSKLLCNMHTLVCMTVLY